MLYLFDKNENLIHELASEEIESLIQHEELNKLMTLEFAVFIDSNDKMKNIEYVAHKDMEDYEKIQMYRVISSESDDYTVNYQAVHIIFDELKSYGYIRDKRPDKVKASVALNIALAGSRWKVGRVDDSDLLSTNFYDCTRLDALSKIIKTWNLDLHFYLTFDGNKITGRYIDLLGFRGEDTGERFVYGSNALEVVKEVDVSEVYTRVIPRGKGEEKLDEEGKPTDGYGRRIKIDDVVWEKSKGDPLDKPKGQEFIELKEMTNKFGFSDGEPRTRVQIFEDIEDPKELIKAGYDFLVKVSRPLVQFKTKISKRSRTNVGDIVRIIRKDLDFYYRTRIYKAHRNLLNETLEVEFGDKLVQSPADREKIVSDSLNSLEERIKETETDLKSSFVDKVNEGITHATFNRDGYNYELKKGNKYGLPAGYYSFDREIDDNPQRVIYVGAGTLAIADSKKSNGDWNFRTFGTGQGFVADLLVAGTILGGNVRWNLEDGTFLIGKNADDYSMYWDGGTLHFRNVDIDLKNSKDFSQIKDDLDKKISKEDVLEDKEIQEALRGKDGANGVPGKDGKDGMPGKPGADGKTSYMHFAYADSQDGVVGFTLTATTGKKYIGFYTDFTKEDSKDPKKYEWSKYVGDDGKPGKDGVNGIPGKAGVDGKTPYFHTAWANSSDGSKDFSVSQAGEKLYIGTYTDYTKEDSTDPKKYTWQLVKGNKGEPGTDGKDGGEFQWNLLLNGDKEIIDSTEYNFAKYELAEDIPEGSVVTFLIKMKGKRDPNWLKIFNSGGYYRTIKDIWLPDNSDKDYTIYSVTNTWKVNEAKNEYLSLFFGEYNRDPYAPFSVKWVKLVYGSNPSLDFAPARSEIYGKDGKTGKIGQNLLRNSNVPVSNKDYPTNIWTLCETPTTGETMTFTVKIKVEKDDKINSFNSNGGINLGDWKKITKAEDYQIWSKTFNWIDKNINKGIEQTNPPSLWLYTFGNRDNPSNTVSIEWATLTRGDIPAIEWSPCYADVDDAIKAGKEETEEVSRKLIKVESDFKVDSNNIKASVSSLSKTTERSFVNLKKDMAAADAKVETGIKNYLINNYSTKTQTDQKISQEVGSVKASIGSLNQEITRTKSSIEQTNKKIETKVSKDRFSSLVKQEFDSYTVQARNINFDGYVSVKGEFTTNYSDGHPGINIKDNAIEFFDKRVENRHFGRLVVTQNINLQDRYSLSLGHYNRGSMALTYKDPNKNYWNSYVSFDKFNHLGNNANYPIIFYEGTLFKHWVRFDNGIWINNTMHIRSYADGLAILNNANYGLFITKEGGVYVMEGVGKTRKL